MKSRRHSHLGKVFISHTASDKPFVRRLAARIEADDYEVWLDEHALVAGDPLAERIADALRRAKVVLVVVSHKSVASRWLRYELNSATERMIRGECRVIPIVIDDAELPAEVRSLLYADCRRSLRAGWKSVQTALQHEARRSLEKQSFYHHVDRLLKRFFSTGFTMTMAEYGGDDFNVITLSTKDHQGNEIDVPYESIDSYTDPPKPLADAWWSDYSDAAERMSHPYSLIVSNRPVTLQFDVAHSETTRIGLRNVDDSGISSSEHQVIFVDLSGMPDEVDRRRLMALAHVFLNTEAAKRFGKPIEGRPATPETKASGRVTKAPRTRPKRQTTRRSPFRR